MDNKTIEPTEQNDKLISDYLAIEIKKNMKAKSNKTILNNIGVECF
jgi:hypothetical protein